MLRSAERLSDLQRQGRFHQLRHDLDGVFSLQVGGGYCLLCEPDHDPIPRLPDGVIDREKVTRVKILKIDNYHD